MGGCPITDELLSLIRDTLSHLKDEAHPPLFASPEDADYFRKLAKAKAPERAAPPPLPEIVLPKREPPKPAPEIQRVQPEPAKAPPPEPVKEKSAFVPAALPETPPPDFNSLRALFAKIAPGFPLLDEIPCDEIAKKIATRWKTKNQTAPISILSYQEPPAQRALLEQIAKAIDVSFGPARLVQAESIEKDKQWEAFLSVPDLKWVIACDYSLWQLGGLMHFYKENPAQATRELGKVPLFLLPDLSLYLKAPLLKRSLWKALYQEGLKNRVLPRRRPEFGSGAAGDEAAKLEKFSDAVGSQSQWLSDAGRTDS